MEFFSTFGGNRFLRGWSRGARRGRDEGLQQNAKKSVITGLLVSRSAQKHEILGDIRGSGLFLVSFGRNRERASLRQCKPLIS